MSGIAYLAMRYLARHKAVSAVLVSALALVLFLPVGLRVAVQQSAESLRERAAATPLVIGAPGSPIDLVLASLYFESGSPAPLAVSELQRVAATGLADPVPLHVRFRTGGFPIVGTDLAYFEHRKLRVAAGRPLALLGECVVGAAAARALNVAPGDSVVSSPETVFDLAGTYPLRMPVVGILAPSFGPDDDAVFVDLKTAWIIQGLAHGHSDLAKPGANAQVLSREGESITANASVVEYNQITPENAASFHVHGNAGEHPITSVLAFTPDDRSRSLLMGRYEADLGRQILRPGHVIDELLATVFAVERSVVVAIGLVGVATLAVGALVFVLSARLRRREFSTLVKIGAPRGTVAALLGAEIALVTGVALVCAAGLVVLAARVAPVLLRSALVP
jgi:putative ABC transport system permease protein